MTYRPVTMLVCYVLFHVLRKYGKHKSASEINILTCTRAHVMKVNRWANIEPEAKATDVNCCLWKTLLDSPIMLHTQIEPSMNGICRTV